MAKMFEVTSEKAIGLGCYCSGQDWRVLGRKTRIGTWAPFSKSRCNPLSNINALQQGLFHRFPLYKGNGHLSNDRCGEAGGASQIHVGRGSLVPHPGIAEHNPGDGSQPAQGFIDAVVEGAATRIAGIVDGAVKNKSGVDSQHAEHGKANPVGWPEPHGAQGSDRSDLDEKEWRPPVKGIAEFAHG